MILRNLTYLVETNLLSLRDDILDMEDVARMFEQEKDVTNEVQQQSKIATDMILLSKLYPVTENEVYDPYCKIFFGPGNNKRCGGSEILDASTICSSSESLSLTNHQVQGDSNYTVDVGNMCQESEDFDSGTFRVKRRSSSKSEQRNAHDSVPPGFENQHLYPRGLKRLKKVQPEGRSQHDSASECSIHSKEANHSASNKGTTTHISIKYNKTGNEEAVSKYKNYNLHHDPRKTTREPLPLEKGPKRLKVKGPSIIGLENTGRIDH